MRAIWYERPGPAAEVLNFGELPDPEPGPGEVRVRVALSAINPTDVKRRERGREVGLFARIIPHNDGAGVIDRVGEGVPAQRLGARVWIFGAQAGRPFGTAARFVVLPERQAIRLPDVATIEDGACLGIPAVTAHRCLFADGPVDGKAVLVAGGAGAVGHFAIELAKQAGARVVSTVSSPEKAELASKAGADRVVNYRDGDAAEQIRAFAQRMDRIVEVALGANTELDLAVSGPGTVIVTYAAEPKDPVLPVRACMTANVVLRFILLYGVPRPSLDQAAREVSAALAVGALSELPLHRFPLDDIAAAHEAVEAGAVGKVLVDIP